MSILVQIGNDMEGVKLKGLAFELCYIQSQSVKV